MRRLMLAALMAVTAAVMLPAQSETPRFVVHAPAGLEDAGATAEELSEVLLDALQVELESKGLDVAAASGTGSGEDAAETGQGAVHVRSRIRRDGARFIFVIRAEVLGESIAGTTVYGVEGFSALNTVSRAVDALMPQLPSELRPAEAAAEDGEDAGDAGRASEERRLIRRPLRFQTDTRGMQLAIAGGPTLGSAEDGIVEAHYVPLVVPAVIDIEKSAPGYYSEVERVQITEEQETIALSPLRKAHRHMVYVSYTSGQTLGAGVGYRYFALPDRLFLEAEVYPYAQISRELENAEPVMHGDLRASVGGYLSQAEAQWRFFITSGFGTVATRPSGGDVSWFWDHYVSIFTLGVGYTRGPFSVFLRSEAKWALGSAFLERGPLDSSSGPFFTLGVGWKL